MTRKTLFISAGGLAGIILTIIFIFLFISWIKRKSIAESARRLSLVTQKATNKIRKTIRRAT